MMANKHLRELLKEDQEPFFLKNYIDDRRSQLMKRTTLQVKKRKPILVESSNSQRSGLCQQACFFTFVDSPDVRKSPFLDFPSPAARCPGNKTPNGVLLHIPARTAALLLEAAMRIQKQSSSSSSPRPKAQPRNLGFALFGSILKRLSGKNRSRKREIAGEGGGISARKSEGESEKVQENVVGAVDEKGSLEMVFACSCSNSRRNSGVWSESNEEKSLDMESSSSCRSEDSEERENGSYVLCDKHFCSSSPFRFTLQNSSPSGDRTPNFSSPATCPRRLNDKQGENCETVSMQKNHPEEEEEAKEQCSPVSVLDPLFEDKGGQENDGDNDHEEDYDLECSYAIVQKAKQQLLQKLRRFEKLAELDPVELERRMLEEQDEDENEDIEEEEECEEDEDSLSLYAEKTVDGLVREVLNKSGICKVSADMKRLVLDLVAEEKRSEEGGIDDSEVVVKRVCRRLDSWKEVESNTIDMMVELDFRRELEGWKRNDQEQMRQTATEIELAIFGLLVGELSEELLCFTGV